MHRYNAAKSIIREIHSGYIFTTDYWGPLRSHISFVLSHSGKAEDLDSVINKISSDKKDNYLEKIEGIKKFWGKKRFTKITLNKKVWKHKNIRINVTPEMSYAYKDKTYVIKLFFSSNDKSISKNEADMLLEIMRDSLDVNPKEVNLGVLDVSRDKLFKYSNPSAELLYFVQAEAEELYKTLEKIEKTDNNSDPL